MNCLHGLHTALERQSPGSDSLEQLVHRTNPPVHRTERPVVVQRMPPVAVAHRKLAAAAASCCSQVVVVALSPSCLGNLFNQSAI